MTTIGLVGAGHMGSALGAALREGGHDVVTTLAGRSARTAALVAGKPGSRPCPTSKPLSPRPAWCWLSRLPGAAVTAAVDIAAAAGATGARPLVVDLNAVSPSTMERVAEILAGASLDLVDGSISGPPPTVSVRVPASTSRDLGSKRSPDSAGATSDPSSSATPSAWLAQ